MSEYLHSAKRNKVKTVVICSSTASTNPNEQIDKKNEIDHWSDESTQIENKKFTSAAKTVMEKRAIKFCKNKIRLCIFLPTGLYGELLIPEHLKHNPYSWLNSLLNGGEPRHATCLMIRINDTYRGFSGTNSSRLEHDVFEGRFLGSMRACIGRIYTASVKLKFPIWSNRYTLPLELPSQPNLISPEKQSRC